MKKHLLKEEVLHADEKTHIYEYGPSQSSEVPLTFLKGYQGYLHSDGFSTYGKLIDVTSVACFAHVRRKFYDALPAKEGEKKSTSRLAVEKCDVIFKKEKELAELSVKKCHSKREQFVKPKLDEFFEWLKTFNPMIKGKIGRAIFYALKQYTKVKTVFERWSLSTY